MAKKSDYSLFIIFFFNSLKNRIIHYFRPSLFTIHYFFTHYSLFIIKKGLYSLIIIPHPDPRSGKMKNLFFLLRNTIFYVKPNMFTF